MSLKSIAITALLGLVCVGATFAQSNAAMDQILASDALDYGKAAYLVLVASDNIAEDAGESRSFEMLQSLGWIGADRKAVDTISLAEYSYILMRAFGLKGGILYTVVPGPRYAFRELVFRGMLQGRADPQDKLSGQRALRILGRILDFEEGAR